MITSETTTKIFSKLWEIMKDVDYIQKDKENTFHRYRYASEAAIKEKCHEALVKHKVIFNVEAEPYHTDIIKNVKGGEDVLEKVVVTWRFTDVETGEFISGKGLGSGIDSGDKGTYKAITGALKYVLTGNFLIPTGDDPENEAPPIPPVKVAPSYIGRKNPPLGKLNPVPMPGGPTEPFVPPFN
jgi:hypothetical protein